jgi:hypothetical protein
MRIAAWVAVAVALTAPRLAQAGTAAIFIPPLEVEWGEVSTASPNGPILTGEVLVGLSWASVFPRSTPVDISVGFITIGSTESTSPTTASKRTVPGGAAEEPAHTSGTYVAADVRLREGPHWRTWIGGRGEVLDVGGQPALGGFGRMSAEVWAGGMGSDRNFLLLGTFAFSGWVEMGVRQRADHGRASVLGAGLGLRVPLMFASG